MNNLKILRKNAKKTQAQMGAFLGITQQAYAAYENDTAKPPYDILNKLATYFDVSVDYLLGRTLTANLPSNVRNVYPLESPIRLPVYGAIAAGSPINTSQSPTDEWIYEDPKYGDGNHFVLRVEGDSMAPEITTGSYAIIRHQNYATPGQIVAVCLNGEYATLKRYEPQANGSILFKADNPAAQSYVISQQEFQNGDAYILGVLREIKRKYY